MNAEDEETKIFMVRATVGREQQLINRLAGRIEKEGHEIYLVMKPEEIKGYIFVEAPNRETVAEAIYGLRHAKGVIDNPIDFDQIKHFLEPAAQKIVVNPNDIVELISGPYKGEKAKVKRVDRQKEKIVVELLEAAVPIPITVSLDSIRVIDRKSGENAIERI